MGIEQTSDQDIAAVEDQPYDGRKLSYATTFPNPLQRKTIQTIEFLTGKWRLLSRIRAFERRGIPKGHAFFAQALDVMGIDVKTPAEQLAHIPKSGPVIITANHPHGLVDGMVLAELIGRVRKDYKILTRSLLTDVDQIADFMIPVPFDHEEDAIAKSIEMRMRAMEHLANDGVIVIFPSGKVASSDTMMGPVVEREWNPFTAKMIQRSNASVVPVFFPGANSRLYQIANQISATLRQGLLIREVVIAMNKPQAPIVRAAIDRDEIQEWSSDPRGFMKWLRAKTIGTA